MSTPTRVTRSPASRGSRRSTRGWRRAAPCRARPRRDGTCRCGRAPSSARAAAPGDVGLDVVADHPRHLRVRVESLERRAEVGALGFPTTVASTSAAYSRPATKQPGVEERPARGLPPAVLVQAVELGTQPSSSERPARGSCTRRRGSSPRSRPLRPGAPRRRPRPRAGRRRDPRAPRPSSAPGPASRKRTTGRERRSSGAPRPSSSKPIDHGAPRRAIGSTAWCCWSRTAGGGRSRGAAAPRPAHLGSARRTRGGRRRCPGEWRPWTASLFR